MSHYSIKISVSKQQLQLYSHDTLLKTYPIATAKNGVGEKPNSFCTPRGQHSIAEKIGHDAKPNAVFVARQLTGEIYDADLEAAQPERDWILTRILWLSGLEAHNANTQQRYIYIHGSPNHGITGTPSSQGCIRMRTPDLIELFDLLDVGDSVFISEN